MERKEMTVELTRKTRVGRVLSVQLPSGHYKVQYNGYGIGGESVLVNGEIVARQTSWLRMVPRFEFAVGPHVGVIQIQTKLWRDLLGPILGRLESFSFRVDGQVLYED
jgi:hypothetical protein